MPVDPKQLHAFMNELRRRSGGVKKQADLLAGMTDSQRAMVDDEARQVAVLGTRRSGKSRSWLRKMIQTAKDIPGSTQFYINTSLGECERIAWLGTRASPGLVPICAGLGIGKPNETKKRMTFPEWGGSYIELIGADDERAVKKLLGSAPDRVWIDEAQKMPAVEIMIRQVVTAAMSDFNGQVVMTGTPNEYCSGYFYDITRDDGEAKAEGWKIHRLNVLDNPFFGSTREERFENTIKRAMVLNNWKGDEPELLRDWYGKWVKSDAKFVYHVHRADPATMLYDGVLPALSPRYRWRYVIGFDLGYEPDPFAWVVWAWNDGSPDLWEVEAGKEYKLTPKSMAEAAAALIETYNPEAVVADAGGLGKAIVHGWSEEWHDRFGLPVEEAEKSNKETIIATYNGELIEGRIHLLRDGLLVKEQGSITWLPTKPGVKRRENPKDPNDVADAALYAYRFALHHRFTPEQLKPVYGSDEYRRREEIEMEEAILQRLAEDEELEMEFV